MSAVSLGFLNLPQDSELVSDADEEVFLIYTELQSAPSENSNFRGLGYLDSRTDLLELKFELNGSVLNKKGAMKLQTKVVEIQLAQDKTSLRSRKGDTGSVLWRASIDFAQLILQQSYFPGSEVLFEPSKFKELNVLELGAGTGLLGIVLSPLVNHYVVTDIASLVPLIRKNVGLNNSSGAPVDNISVQEFDWLTLASTPTAHRSRFFSISPAPDLVLVIDCIYHPSLLPALVESVDFLAVPNQTIVLITVELRSEDVVREFLQLWTMKPNWVIWRIGRQSGLKMPYVMWAGMKMQ